MISLHYDANSHIRSAVQAAIPSNKHNRVDWIPTSWDARPREADLVLTTGSLTSDIERFAARLGGYPVVLPEAGQWLKSQVDKSFRRGVDLVMVDAALLRVKVK
jgi:hypothetical protein